MQHPVHLLGVRGYYADSFGVLKVNDFGIYDDAIFLISGSAFASFNANTDPTVKRKAVAVLCPGTWLYKIGIHGISKPANRRYRALVQAAPVTVSRYQTGLDNGMFGINIHRGSYTTTSSLGCQTIWPDQWEAFISLIESEMKRYSMKNIPYTLVEQAG